MEQDSRALRRLEQELGLEGLQALFHELVDPREDYELGVACGRAGAEEALLLSYNPRSRRTDFRRRAASALALRGLPLEPLRPLLRAAPRALSSTILGVEFRVDSAVEATLYVEEIEQRMGREGAQALVDAFAPALGRCGSVQAPLYILAMDLPQGRPKVYRLHERPPTGLLQGAEDLLAPGASAWIEQWRDPLTPKLYRCFDYPRGQGEPAAGRPLVREEGPWTAHLFDHLPRIMGRAVRLTSVGRRAGAAGGYTVYWCASGPGVP